MQIEIVYGVDNEKSEELPPIPEGRKYHTPVKPADDPHNPQYQYHCEACKFSWNCGYCCGCAYLHKLPEPPLSVQRKVNASLIKGGYYPQFSIDGVQGERR